MSASKRNINDTNCNQTENNNQSFSRFARKRQILTLKTKVQIINKFESGEKICDISKIFNLPNSTVGSIVRDRKRILAASKHNSLNSSTVIRKRHGIIAQMECKLKTWCEQQVERNIKLTRNEVCAQAKTIFETMKKDYGDVAKDVSFLGSKGWYFRFKQRCDDNRSIYTKKETIEGDNPVKKVKRERKEDKMIVDVTKKTNINKENTFTGYLETLIADGGYTSQTVFNVDEIGLYWKRMPDKSFLAQHDSKNKTFNESKDRLTILLGGNATGDLKLKPFMIYRMENPRALRTKCKSGLPVVWRSNSKACMTAGLFEDWFGNYFIPEVERYCFANNIPCKVLLILDNADYHPPSTLLDFDHRVNVVFLPPGEVTSIQPMCSTILNVFRSIYTRRVFQYLIETAKQNDFLTVGELWTDYSILDAIRIIVDTWAEIPINDWKVSWNKFCPFFGEDTLVESSSAIHEDIVKLALELEMKIDKKDVSELLHSHNKELTIEELIEMQEYINDDINNQDSQDPLLNERAMNVGSLTEAFSHIKIGLQILENIDSNEQRARLTRLGVMKLLGAYDEIMKEKIKCMGQQ